MTANPLEALHGGWPFGPGPDEWPWHVRHLPASETGSQPAGLHVCCSRCGQSVMRLGQWSLTWNSPFEQRGPASAADGSLKPHIALHVMQVHSEQVTG